jgi:hypothetical protein
MSILLSDLNKEELILLIIEKLDKDNNGLKSIAITKYLNPFFMIFNFSQIHNDLSHECMYFNNLTIILKVLHYLRDCHILLFDENKETYSINKKHGAYKSFHIKYDTFISSIGELFNISLLNNLEDDSIKNKADDESEYNDECEEDNESEEDEEDNESEEEHKLSSDNKPTFLKSSLYYCYDSNTNHDNHHFIDADKNSCSCKGFLYRQKCIHMKNVKKDKYDNLITYSKEDDKYYCTVCNTNEKCIHLDNLFVHITEK